MGPYFYGVYSGCHLPVQRSYLPELNAIDVRGQINFNCVAPLTTCRPYVMEIFTFILETINCGNIEPKYTYLTFMRLPKASELNVLKSVCIIVHRYLKYYRTAAVLQK